MTCTEFICDNKETKLNGRCRERIIRFLTGRTTSSFLSGPYLLTLGMNNDNNICNITADVRLVNDLRIDYITLNFVSKTSIFKPQSLCTLYLEV
jgi:hypothetical protein